MPSGIVASPNEAVNLRFEGPSLHVELRDGREHVVPLVFYPTLRDASAAHRENWRFVGHGRGIYWPDLDLDLTTEGILKGNREHFPPPPPRRPEAKAVDVMVKHEPQGWVVLWVVRSRSRAAVCTTKKEAIETARALANGNSSVRVMVRDQGGKSRKPTRVKDPSRRVTARAQVLAVRRAHR